jgi:hypothetical protein
MLFMWYFPLPDQRTMSHRHLNWEEIASRKSTGTMSGWKEHQPSQRHRRRTLRVCCASDGGGSERGEFENKLQGQSQQGWHLC